MRKSRFRVGEAGVFRSARGEPSCCQEGRLRFTWGHCASLPLLGAAESPSPALCPAAAVSGAAPWARAAASPEALTTRVIYAILWSVGAPGSGALSQHVSVTRKVPQPQLTETVRQEVSGWGDHEDCFLRGDEPFPMAVCSVLSEQVWKPQTIDKCPFP